MPKGRRRDVYKGRHDAGFDIDKDIDLEHMREISAMEDPSNEDYNFYGLYVRNIIRIMLNAAKFRGYPDDVKEDIMGEALIDCLKARRKFRGEDYPQPTAVFNYTYRIAYHSAQHILARYYLMQNRMVAASQVGQGTHLMDSPEEFTDDIIEKAVNDWDAIAENLRSAEPVGDGKG